MEDLGALSRCHLTTKLRKRKAIYLISPNFRAIKVLAETPTPSWIALNFPNAMKLEEASHHCTVKAIMFHFEKILLNITFSVRIRAAMLNSGLRVVHFIADCKKRNHINIWNSLKRFLISCESRHKLYSIFYTLYHSSYMVTNAISTTIHFQLF